jgi:hypothetical protein
MVLRSLWERVLWGLTEGPDNALKIMQIGYFYPLLNTYV